MFGMEFFSPDTLFDESFNSLIVVETFTYSGGTDPEAIDKHPIDNDPTIFTFARPLTAAPDATLQAHLLPVEFGGDGYPDGFFFGKPGVSVFYPFEVVVCRPSKTVNPIFSAGYGFAVYDQLTGIQVFNSNGKYVYYKNSGTGYGKGVSQPTLDTTAHTYVSVDAWRKSYFAINGLDGGYFSGLHLSYTPIFNGEENTISWYTGDDYTATKWVAFYSTLVNSTGHWLVVDIY